MPNPMSDVAGRRILVVGASGGVGEGITRALMQAGATVRAVGRSRDGLERLATHVGDGLPGSLELHVADVTSGSAGPGLAAVVAQDGSFDAAVLSIGDPGDGRVRSVLDLDDDEVLRMMRANELGGLKALQAVVPAVKKDGSVISLLGFSSEVPFPHNPLMASTNAALRSLVSTLGAQLQESGPRVHGLVLGVVRTRARQEAGVDNQNWLTGEQVGERISRLIAESTPPGVTYLLDPQTEQFAREWWRSRD